MGETAARSSAPRSPAPRIIEAVQHRRDPVAALRRILPPVPPIEQLQRVPPLLLQRLERQGVFTTGLLLEVSETRTRRQTLADQVGVTTNDVNDWRDEALLLNLASFGPDEQRSFTQAGIIGLRDFLALDRDTLGARLERAARTLGLEPPSDITVDGWFAQARTLEDE